MKRKKSTNMAITLIAIYMTACMFSCKEDDKPKLLPEISTTPVTEITTSTAMSGGEIISDGNDAITILGICWSDTNQNPTINDNKIELSSVDENFTSKMENLSSGTTYHVRAYVTNSVGTGYGESIAFVTGNAPPTAISISITGKAEVNKELTGTYTYSDENNDIEGSTTVQWYRATDASGTAEVAITGAVSPTYKLQDIDEFKYIRIGITPKAVTGNTSGIQVNSSYVGPIAIRTTVTFTYNGSEVTYGIITSSVTGRKWLDRNLGASNAPSSYNDYSNYGDLFQWGRSSDGHQLINRNATNATYSSVNGITTTLSNSDMPGHNLFISSTAIPRDWRSPQNNNLWQINGDINNPCPNGWHIPTETEWDAENLNDVISAYSKLKINYAGQGRFRDGTIGNPYYWSSSTSVLPSGSIVSIVYDFEVGGLETPKTTTYRANGHTCRCISNK